MAKISVLDGYRTAWPSIPTAQPEKRKGFMRLRVGASFRTADRQEFKNEIGEGGWEGLAGSLLRSNGPGCSPNVKLASEV